MSQHSTIDNISRMLSVLRMLAREEGATVSEISKATGIDRWTVRDMIDRMEDLSPDGKGLRIEEFDNELDKRQTRYRVPKSSLWTITIPGMNLNDEEALLLELLFEQSRNNPLLKDSADSLKKKICMFQNLKKYEILSKSTVNKIETEKTKTIMMAVLDAINRSKCLVIRYKPVNRDVQDYRIMPLGVFKYDAGFYLAAQKLPDGEYRTFGIERVLDSPVEFDFDGALPERFDFEELFDDPFGPFNHCEEFEAVLKFDAYHGVFNEEKAWPGDVKIEKQPDGSVIMRAKTKSYSGVEEYILSFGDGVEVLEPAWLREKIKETQLKAASLYE